MTLNFLCYKRKKNKKIYEKKEILSSFFGYNGGIKKNDFSRFIQLIKYQ